MPGYRAPTRLNVLAPTIDVGIWSSATLSASVHLALARFQIFMISSSTFTVKFNKYEPLFHKNQNAEFISAHSLTLLFVIFSSTFSYNRKRCILATGFNNMTFLPPKQIIWSFHFNSGRSWPTIPCWKPPGDRLRLPSLLKIAKSILLLYVPNAIPWIFQPRQSEEKWHPKAQCEALFWSAVLSDLPLLSIDKLVCVLSSRTSGSLAWCCCDTLKVVALFDGQ